MTTPVTLALAPSGRTGAPSDGGGPDSAAPFASALDGALSAGRSEVDGAGAQGGGHPDAEQDETPEPDAGPGAPGEPAPAAPGVVATAWALLSGPAKAAAAHGGPADGTDLPGAGTPVAAGHGPGAPGLVRASERGQASRTAHGLLGSSPTPGVAEAPAAAASAATSAAATPLPSPVVAAAAALQAAGIDAVQVGTGVATATGTSVPAAPGTPPAAATVEADGAPAPASTSPVLPLPATAPDAATSNGAADAGTGSGTDRGPESAARTDSLPTAAATGPAGPPVPVARSETAPGTAVAPPVSGQIARQVAVLRGGPDGTHTMTVVLTPETLGPVEVSVTVSQGAVELTLRGAHEHGRAALAEALPHLRRDLEAAGLTCSRLDVDRGTSWSPSAQSGRSGEQGPGGHGPGGRGHQQDRSDGGARPWQRSADTAEGRRTAASHGASALDVRV